MRLDADSELATRVKECILAGDTPALRQLLSTSPELATAVIGNAREARSLLHIATDWPGHYPNSPDIIRLLVEAGADVNARFVGSHEETPLHWAASNDDVAAIDALLDNGADIDASGGVIADGTPLTDARAFLQRSAAARLIERGAECDLHDAATLGLLDVLETELAKGPTPPSAKEVSLAFWNACHGGQSAAAKLLLERGADVNIVPPWEAATPLDAARRGEYAELTAWLGTVGAQSFEQQRRETESLKEQ
jgi:uncharacterized protein